MSGTHNNPQGKSPSPTESPPKLTIQIPSTKASNTLKDLLLRMRRQLSKMDSEIDHLYNVSNSHNSHHKQSLQRLQRHQRTLQDHQKKLAYHQEMLEKVTDDHLPFESVKKELVSLQTTVRLQQHAMEDLKQRLVRQIQKKATKKQTQWVMNELRQRIDILTQMIQHPDKKQTLQAQLDALDLRKIDITKIQHNQQQTHIRF